MSRAKKPVFFALRSEGRPFPFHEDGVTKPYYMDRLILNWKQSEGGEGWCASGDGVLIVQLVGRYHLALVEDK